MADTTTKCECIAAPCNCDGQTPVEPSPPMKWIDWLKKGAAAPPPVINNYYLTQPAATADPASSAGNSTNADASSQEETLIFGIKPIYALGIGVAALFLFSSMDGKK